MRLFREDVQAQLEDGSFVLELLRARLFRSDSKMGVAYRGVARVHQENGRLHLRFYCELTSEQFKDEIRRFNSNHHTLGQIVPRESYYFLEGTDIEGSTWSADEVFIRSFPNLNNNLWVLTAGIRSLKTQTTAYEATAREVSLWVPGDYSLPYTDLDPTREVTGFAHLSISLGNGVACKITRTKNEGILIAATADDQELYELCDLLIESIGFAIGAFLSPVITAITENGKTSEELASHEADEARRRRIPAPIPTQYPDEIEDFQQFLQKYITAVKKPFSPLAAYWYGVLYGAGSSHENESLILTTTIEGIAKFAFSKEFSQDLDFRSQARNAKRLMRPLKLTQRVRKAIYQKLGDAGGLSALNILRALRNKGKITGELVQAWQDLRPLAAHGVHREHESLAELQGQFDQRHTCMELFYRLILLHLGYDGRLRKFGSRGWPVKRMGEN